MLAVLHSSPQTSRQTLTNMSASRVHLVYDNCCSIAGILVTGFNLWLLVTGCSMCETPILRKWTEWIETNLNKGYDDHNMQNNNSKTGFWCPEVLHFKTNLRLLTFANAHCYVKLKGLRGNSSLVLDNCSKNFFSLVKLHWLSYSPFLLNVIFDLGSPFYCF